MFHIGMLLANLACEPCLRTLPDGKKEVIFVDSAHGISGVGLKTGKVHWQADLLPGHLRDTYMV